MQRLGQHFLKNARVVEKIIGALNISANDAVIEIGPGRGALTLPLLKACTEVGATLTVIEKDERLAEKLGPQLMNAATLTTGDALKVLPGIMEAYGPVSGKGDVRILKLAGNLPYYITGKLLRIISDASSKPERCVFMVQREVADRICAAPPRMNRLAASVQFWADAEIVASVPRQDFSPPPEVESAVILLKAKDSAPREAAEQYYRAVRAIFAQPRKTLFNNIAAGLKGVEVSKEELSEKMEAIGDGIGPSLRPQDLSIRQIIRIAEALF